MGFIIIRINCITAAGKLDQTHAVKVAMDVSMRGRKLNEIAEVLIVERAGGGNVAAEQTLGNVLRDIVIRAQKGCGEGGNAVKTSDSDHQKRVEKIHP